MPTDDRNQSGFQQEPQRQDSGRLDDKDRIRGDKPLSQRDGTNTYELTPEASSARLGPGRGMWHLDDDDL